MIRVESTRITAGVVEHGSPFAGIDLTGDPVPRPRLGALAGAGPVTRVLDDETTALWEKTAFLAPLTTCHGPSLGGVRTAHREELLALVEETAAISRACGGPSDPARALARHDALPAGTRSSMQRDAEAGRPWNRTPSAVRCSMRRNGTASPSPRPRAWWASRPAARRDGRAGSVRRGPAAGPARLHDRVNRAGKPVV